MSTDAKAVIGTIVGTGLVIAGLLVTQIAGVNNRIDDVNNRIDDVNVRFDDGLSSQGRTAKTGE